MNARLKARLQEDESSTAPKTAGEIAICGVSDDDPLTEIVTVVSDRDLRVEVVSNWDPQTISVSVYGVGGANACRNSPRGDFSGFAFDAPPERLEQLVAMLNHAIRTARQVRNSPLVKK